MARNAQPDADDMFSETRMSFGDHIEDLRKHLMRAIIGFVAAMILSMFIANPVLEFIKAPIELALKESKARRVQKLGVELENHVNPALQKANEPKTITYYVRPGDLIRLFASALEKTPPQGANAPNKEELAAAKLLTSALAKLYPPVQPGENRNEDWVPLQFQFRPVEQALAGQEGESLVRDSDKLNVFGITEGMMVWLKVAMICGVVIGSPWIFLQVWSFVAAGLYSTEKKLVHVYMPFSLFLFLCGVFLCELVVIPQAVRFLLEFNEWLGVNPELRLEDWLSFALLMPLVFGISFQTPLIMLFLAKIGIFDAASFRAKRRIAWFVLMVGAALIMPTTDIYTIFMMQVPLIALYEFGILLAAYVDRQRAAEQVDETDEDVGV
ncbi:twin-arginine translocase subunit TatC [soil metagenome]